MPSRVLIVEDEPDIRGLLVFHLEREGYQVVRSSDGADALRQVRARPPDLVLLDLMLPGMDGLEVCRRLRQDPATAPLPRCCSTLARASWARSRRVWSGVRILIAATLIAPVGRAAGRR